MKAVVLGHLVLDEIHTLTGAVVESMGGIHFALSAMASLADDGDHVAPVMPVGEDAWTEFLRLYDGHPRLDAGGCHRVAQPNTRVRLHHASLSHYNTQLVRSLGPINMADVEQAAADADLVYLNMMTGEDLLLEDAERLRSVTTGLVYLDLHMIAYRVARGGNRDIHQLDQWERWAGVPHVLQCNEQEFTVLGGSATDEDDRIERVLARTDLRLLVITRGERGVTLVEHTGARLDLPAARPRDVVDPTGCGDVFGATMAWRLASGCAPSDAARDAVRAAAFVISIPGSHGIERLADALVERTE